MNISIATMIILLFIQIQLLCVIVLLSSIRNKIK